MAREYGGGCRLYIKSGQNAQRRYGALLLRCVVGSKSWSLRPGWSSAGLQLSCFYYQEVIERGRRTTFGVKRELLIAFSSSTCAHGRGPPHLPSGYGLWYYWCDKSLPS
eukprot:scaffold15439_cov99-Skeletonema_marinoi.AAC.1